MEVWDAENPEGCVYCGKTIAPREDWQYVDKRVAAHTRCAWLVAEGKEVEP